MSAETAVRAGRMAAERRMTSRVTVRRRTGDTTTAANGNEVDEWVAVHSDLPFRLGGSTGASGFRKVSIGGSEVDVAVRVGSFPADTSDLRDLDFVDVTEGENAGVVLCIAEASWADQQTARRVPVFEVQRPEEWG